MDGRENDTSKPDGQEGNMSILFQTNLAYHAAIVEWARKIIEMIESENQLGLQAEARSLEVITMIDPT